MTKVIEQSKKCGGERQRRIKGKGIKVSCKGDNIRVNGKGKEYIGIKEWMSERREKIKCRSNREGTRL